MLNSPNLLDAVLVLAFWSVLKFIRQVLHRFQVFSSFQLFQKQAEIENYLTNSYNYHFRVICSKRDKQSSGFGMTSIFDSVLKCCGILAPFFFCNIAVFAEFFAILRCSEPYNTPLFGVNSVENWVWFQLVSRCWHSFSSCEPCACWSCCKMIEDELEFVMKFIIFEVLFQQYLWTFNKIQIEDNLEAQKSG